MGVNLTPLFSPELPQIIPEGDIRMVITFLDVLDDIAEEEGVKSLSTFLNDINEDEDIDESDLRWFPIHDGLATIRALIQATAEDNRTEYRLEEREILREELQDLEGCLRLAARETASRFCLIIT